MPSENEIPEGSRRVGQGKEVSWSAQIGVPGGPDLRVLDLSGAPLASSSLSLKSADFRGVSLRGANLAGADLEYADLRNADLTDADLRGTNLRLAHLEGAILDGTHFERARLISTSFGKVDLSPAHIEGAEFSDAFLHGATVSRAQLRLLGALGVRLSGVSVRLDSPCRSFEEWAAASAIPEVDRVSTRNIDLSGLDLSHVDLSRMDLSGSCLSGARLSGALLFGTNLSGARLDGADLRDAILVSAKLPGASLIGVDLRDADLGEADLDRADLTGSDLRDAILCHATLKEARLNQADLTGAVLTGAWFIAVQCEGTVVSGPQLESTSTPQLSIRCPICLHRGVLSDHYVWKREHHSLLLWPNDDPMQMWPCGHISRAAYRLYFNRRPNSVTRWLDDIGLGEIGTLGQLVAGRTADLEDGPDAIPRLPDRSLIESCFDRHFRVEEAKVKLSWAGRPTPVFVAPFAEDPDEAVKRGWTDAQGIFLVMVNPFLEGTFGWSAFERTRRRLIERASLEVGDPPTRP